MCPGESCERCGNFCFFFTMCTASLVATMATTVLCVADTATVVTIYVWLAPEFQITKPQTGRGSHSFTFQLNVSAFCGIGGAFRGCSRDV